MQHDERNTLEQHLSREMSNNDSLHKKLDQLTVQCNMLQSDNHKLRSENERAQHMNSLLKNKADAATDECKRAQNKLLQALREISLLRKDRDIGEEELEELMRERAHQDRAQLTALRHAEDTNLKIYERDVQLGEASQKLKLSSNRLAQTEAMRQTQVSKLQESLDERQQQLNQECTQRQQQLAELQKRNTDFLQSQKTQFQVVKELDTAHTNRIQCEAVIGSLHTRGEQMQADQQLMINDLDRMFNIGSCTKQLSQGLRGRPL